MATPSSVRSRFAGIPTAGDPALPRLTVILCTYNRAALLEGAVTSVLGQTGAGTPPFELVVIDNNSTDATRALIARLAARDPRVRYVFQPRQGLSHARNAGILHARAALIAFIDDDLRADPDWAAAIVRAFDEHPDIDVVGGRVLPVWPSPPPAWLTQDHWAPLALADHGDKRFVVTAERPICLIGAGACRRAVFDAVGTFLTDFQRVGDSVGSLEDHDFIVRVLGTGRRGLYVPEIIVRAAVQPDRLERAYHRRWHQGHGHFHALLRSELVERTGIGRMFGVPAHLYRQALHDLAGWARAAVTGASAKAFLHEVRLRFFVGFFRTRLRDFLRRPDRERAAEVMRHGARDVTAGGAGGASGQPGRRGMKAGALVSPVVHGVRRADTRWQRLLRPHVRHVVFDARTAMEFGMMAPLLRRIGADARVRCSLMSSGRPDQVATIFRDAPGGVPILSPRRAMTRHFDAYVAADLVWANLPRGTWRVQMFHGVAGKWHRVYDRPATSMRHWDRLFFINRRRMNNYIASGAIDRRSPAIRLVGMPKSDCLVDGSLNRDAVLEASGFDPRRPAVLYAPTWSRFSSLNAMGENIVRSLVAAGYTVLVKLHENSLDPAYFCSGGEDWPGRLTPLLPRERGLLIRSSDASPWLMAADVLITDHSSIGFEYLLLDRPVVRIAMPRLVAGTDISLEYVQLMAEVSATVETPSGVLTAVGHALAEPRRRSPARRALASELFLNPGAATACAVQELYALMELEAPPSLESAFGAADVGARERSFAQ